MVDGCCMSKVGRGGQRLKKAAHSMDSDSSRFVSHRTIVLLRNDFSDWYCARKSCITQRFNVKLQVWMNSREKSCWKQQCVQVEMLLTLQTWLLDVKHEQSFKLIVYKTIVQNATIQNVKLRGSMNCTRQPCWAQRFFNWYCTKQSCRTQRFTMWR